MELGVFIYEVTNALLAIGWIVLAGALWRVRHHRPLKGGECVVVATLLTYALVRFLILFDYKPWEVPAIMGIMSGLTIMSVVLVVGVLNELAKKKPHCPESTLILNGDIAKAYKALQRNGGK